MAELTSSDHYQNNGRTKNIKHSHKRKLAAFLNSLSTESPGFAVCCYRQDYHRSQ